MLPPKIPTPDFESYPWGDDDSPYELLEKTAQNTEKQLAALEKQLKLAESEVKSAKNAAIFAGIVSVASLIATIIGILLPYVI